MRRYTTPIAAALAALLVTLGSIGSLVTVPETRFAMSPLVPALISRPVEHKENSMTATIQRDPLLAAAKILLMALIGILGFAAVVLAISFLAFLILPSEAIAAMASRGVAIGAEIIPALAFIAAAVAGLIAVAVYFLVLLYRIVRSVREGDPFAPVNAERLARMGWIALIGQIAAISVGLLGIWAGESVGIHAGNANMVVNQSAGIDLSGLLLVLILFILARVFRHGATMREDIEGTV